MKLVLFFVILTVSLFTIAESFPKNSIYHLEETWLSVDGNAVSLKKFAGQPVIMAMTYTGCQYSCPMTFKKLAAIEKDLKIKNVKNYKMVVASFDSQKDTPAVLKAYMSKNNYDPKNWEFITAKDDQTVRQLAVILGISYQKSGANDFSHSNEINLLNSEGVSAVKLKGVSSDHDAIVAKIMSYENTGK